MQIKHSIGNKELLKLANVAFLCSQKVPANVVLKCYDWAIQQREDKRCIISGFHSQLEKDVFHYLAKGTQPIIIVLARGLKERIEPELKQSIEDGRLLIVTPFHKEVKRITKETATLRNRLMMEIADEVVVGFASEQGKLAHLLKSQPINKLRHL